MSFPANVDVRIPSQHDNVFKEECIFSHDTPLTPTGLYVCLEKFVGLGRDHVEQFHKRTGNRVYLHIQRTRTPKKNLPVEEGVPEKVSKMAIGVDGGFRVNEAKFDYQDSYKIALLPEFKEFKMDDSEVPLAVQMSAKGVISAEPALKKMLLEAEAGSWEGETILPSKHADNLEQLANGKKIPPKGWKCEKCDLTNNLWLNLTDGTILCGRKFFDGSGGNNHAIERYNETKYPLAVKLGTITPDGKADVFSYPEDNMVSDPHLAKHLAHYGIQMSAMSKTDKSMAELEIDLNKQWDFSAITEAGTSLQLAYGKGFTGMENLGNTCYMNSIMQLLFTLPPFISTYVDQAPAVFSKANFTDPLNDFKLQTCKLGFSLWSGKYSNPPTEEEKRIYRDLQEDKDKDPDVPQEGIRPQSFKAMVGKGHPEFSTNRQQDAQEFFLHLCSLMERAHVNDTSNPAKTLQFKVEDRIKCGESGKVKYVTRIEDYIPLAIPMECATNKDEVAAFEARNAEAKSRGDRIPEEEVIRPQIPFDACLQSFLSEDVVEGFTSPVTGNKTVALKTNRLATFPEYLLVQLKKFDLDASWTPYKLDVEVNMPDELNLEFLRAKGGIQPGEEEMPAEAEAPAAAQVSADESIVSQLVCMGFDRNGCVKAAINTNNSGLEPAVAWVMDHMADPDFSAPVATPKSSGSSFTPNPDGLTMLMSMGMPEKKCIKALKETDNNVERAVDWIFSHPDDDGSDLSDAPAASSTASASSDLTDGVPNYNLSGFISHIGSSVHVGHYVCHLRKDDGNWYIFNDSKVAKSEKPPKTLGYLYLYKRKK